MKRLILLALVAAVLSCTNGRSQGTAGREGAAPLPKDTAGREGAAPLPKDTAGREGAAPLPKDTLTFAFGGDVMMGTTYPEVQLPPNDGADIFRDVASLLQNADVAAANLEGALLDAEGEPKRCGESGNCYTFKMPERYVKNLADAGFDFMGVANNHSGDFGATGRRRTQEVLTEAGIAFAGLKGDCEYAIIERGGRKIGLTAFGHSTGTLSNMDYADVRRIVSLLDKECDIVVVCFHGGAEGAKYPHVPRKMETFLGANRGDVYKFAHTAVDAGADIVFGHGPHVTRGLELYNDRLIAYSLGNFATPYGMNLSGINSHAPVLTVTTDVEGRFIDGQIHSFIQQKGVGPRKDETNSVARNMRMLTEQDFPETPLKISDTGGLSR